MAENRFLKRIQLHEFPQPDLLKTKYPVFLCHGFGAIGALVKPSPLHDPCMMMRERGILAIAPNVVPYASIDTRARNWVRLIDETLEQYQFEKVNIVAHSMGGLDIRHAMAHLGLADKVASLTTLATPHHGTYLADLVLKTPEIFTEKISEIVDWFGNNVYPSERSETHDSVLQLTMSYVREHFNPNTPDPANVPIFSYSASVGKGTKFSLNPIFLFQNVQIFDKEGPNDSFVSVESAKWGEYLGDINLSHLNQINVQMNKESRQKYHEFWLGLVTQLGEMGF